MRNGLIAMKDIEKPLKIYVGKDFSKKFGKTFKMRSEIEIISINDRIIYLESKSLNTFYKENRR